MRDKRLCNFDFINAQMEHSKLEDMPSSTNTDHDGRYFTETEIGTILEDYILVDGTRAFTGVVGGIIPTAGEHLATKEYVDTAVAGLHFDLFIENTSLSPGFDPYAITTYTLQDTDPGGAEQSLPSANLTADDQLVFAFATGTGLPMDNIQTGVMDGHFHFEKDGGASMTVTAYWTLTRYKDDTTETIITTSEETSEITSKRSFDLHANVATEANIAATDRLVLKVYTKGFGGAVGQLRCWLEGLNMAHVSTRVETETLSNIFIRQDGTKDFTGDQSFAGFDITNVENLTAAVVTIETADTENPLLSFTTTNTAHEIRITLDEDAVNDRLCFRGQTAGVDTHLCVHAVDGQAMSIQLYSGLTNRTDLKMGAADNFTIQNLVEDKNLILNVNQGGTERTITLDGATFTLQSSTGLFDFNDDNIATTGSLTAASGNLIAFANAGDVQFLLNNTAGSGSTDETMSIVAQHTTSNYPGGKIVFGRVNAYGADADRDSFMDFYTALNKVDTLAFRIDEEGNINAQANNYTTTGTIGSGAITSTGLITGIAASIIDVQDGADVQLLLKNTAANGSTNETMSIVAQHTTSNLAGGKIVFGRDGLYGPIGGRDSFMDLYVAIDGVDSPIVRIRQEGIRVDNIFNEAGTDGPLFSLGMFIGTTSTSSHLDDASAGTGSTTFNIGNSTIDVTPPSDESLKSGIIDTAKSGVDIILALRVIDFRYSDPNIVADLETVHTGFSAQEVEAVIPSAVGDYKREGYTGLKYVKQKEFIPMLVKAIQEQETRLTLLEKN